MFYHIVKAIFQNYFQNYFEKVKSEQVQNSFYFRIFKTSQHAHTAFFTLCGRIGKYSPDFQNVTVGKTNLAQNDNQGLKDKKRQA